MFSSGVPGQVVPGHLTLVDGGGEDGDLTTAGEKQEALVTALSMACPQLHETSLQNKCNRCEVSTRT